MPALSPVSSNSSGFIHFSPALKAKRVALAREAADIRRREKRAFKAATGLASNNKIQSSIEALNHGDELHRYRVVDVRFDARHHHLAHAYLLGRSYFTVEILPVPFKMPSQAEVDCSYIARIASHFSGLRITTRMVENWLVSVPPDFVEADV